MKLKVLDINFSGVICPDCLRVLRGFTYASELNDAIIVDDELEARPEEVCCICGKS